MQLSKKELSETQVIVTTPEKWDVITRKGGDVAVAQAVKLLIIDEVHLLNDERGPVIETLIARTQRQVLNCSLSISSISCADYFDCDLQSSSGLPLPYFCICQGCCCSTIRASRPWYPCAAAMHISSFLAGVTTTASCVIMHLTSVQVEASQSMIRIVGLSATLPNYKDVGAFLGVNVDTGLFYFDASYRPVPLEMQFVGVTEKNLFASKGIMDEVCYDKVGTILSVILSPRCHCEPAHPKVLQRLATCCVNNV